MLPAVQRRLDGGCVPQVQTLLAYPAVEVKCLGAELLANYIKAQAREGEGGMRPAAPRRAMPCTCAAQEQS